MGFKLATLLSAALLICSPAAAQLEPIVMKGSKFFYKNGTQFYFKGVAYQQDSAAAGASTGNTSYIDPLADETRCQQDVPLLAALGTNVIRTYAIDPTQNHDTCMSLLADAGIYVISDLSDPTQAINRDDPRWDTELLARYTSVIDDLAQYTNVIGFFAGNEVTNQANNTAGSAYVKAAVRDCKQYIVDKGYRWMGVGYAANDDADIRANIAHYFNCGEDQTQAIDYWGYNIYEWCGNNTIVGSGYQDQVDFFLNYSVPVFFAEYGCNTVAGAAGRIFQETGALYSDDMTVDISGGIVYMYFEEANDYGLVSLVNGQASTMADYNALKTMVLAATPSSTEMAAYTPTNSPAACPPVSDDWEASNTLPLTPNTTVCDCMFSSLDCVPAPNLDATAYGDIFNYICGQNGKLCTGINGNVTTGVYGAYSMCNTTQQLGYVLDQYYQSLSSSADSCNFEGQAQVVKGTTAGCSAVLASADAVNSVAATATSNPTESNVAPGMRFDGVLRMGDFAIGLYMLVALGAGAAMVLL